MYRILVVDDHELIRETLKKALADEGYEVSLAENGRECLQTITAKEIDLILLDMRLPDVNGIDLIQKIRDANQESVVIMMTAFGNIESVKQALTRGAFDFIHKPVKPRALISIVKMALEIRSLRKEIQQGIYKNKERYGYHNIIGNSEALQRVLEVVTRVANSDASTILIEGGSGTGKSLIAKCLHYNSRRAYQPFVEINCASIPANLLESELFGHEAGAFTDAKYLKKGLVESAQGGTLFLDEIGEMTSELQAKILQVIEEKNFRRIGGTKSIEVDIRIIAATNKELKRAIEDKTFRSDLYYRLNVINMYLPALKERKEDIIPLAEYFIHHFSRKFNKSVKSISDEARNMLVRYDWPGNIRELLNTIERIMILEDAEIILPDHLPIEVLKGDEGEEHILKNGSNRSGDFNLKNLTDAFQVQLINKVLEFKNGSRTEAARALGLSRVGLYHQMKRLGLLNKAGVKKKEQTVKDC